MLSKLIAKNEKSNLIEIIREHFEKFEEESSSNTDPKFK